MSKTTFEKLGIPYEERDGIFYPVLVAGTEKADIEAGKYGRMWIKYIKEEYPMRYKSLVRFGELEERADEVNDTAYELLDDIEAKWLKKHKPKNPNSFAEQLQLRTQTRMMAALKRTGMTASAYIRELIWTGGNIDTSYPEDRAKIIRVIADIANNINQAVKLGNSQGKLYYSDIDKLQSSLDDVKKTFGEVLEIWRLQRS